MLFFAIQLIISNSEGLKEQFVLVERRTNSSSVRTKNNKTQGQLAD